MVFGIHKRVGLCTLFRRSQPSLTSHTVRCPGSLQRPGHPELPTSVSSYCDRHNGFDNFAPGTNYAFASHPIDPLVSTGRILEHLVGNYLPHKLFLGQLRPKMAGICV